MTPEERASLIDKIKKKVASVGRFYPGDLEYERLRRLPPEDLGTIHFQKESGDAEELGSGTTTPGVRGGTGVS